MAGVLGVIVVACSAGGGGQGEQRLIVGAVLRVFQGRRCVGPGADRSEQRAKANGPRQSATSPPVGVSGAKKPSVIQGALHRTLLSGEGLMSIVGEAAGGT